MKRLFFMLVLSTITTFSFAQEYKLSILPRFFPERLTTMITPLASYLSAQTGHTISTILTKNFSDYEARVKQGEISIAYQNPVVYVNVSEKHEVLAMALKGKDGDKFRGIVITRTDSDISSLADLHGKLVMIVGENAAGGFLSQKLSLIEQGIDVASMSFEEAADNRQENIIISVSVGEVDAGFIRESAFHKADKYIIPGSIKTIAETAWLPNWGLSVSRGLDATLREKIRTAILALKPAGAVLQALELKGFRPAQDSDYDVLRKIVAGQ